jgi:hypothetical protein
MLRVTALAALALSLGSSVALAQHEVRVESHDGVPQVTLAGEFGGSRYTIYRAASREGPFEAVTSYRVLCIGACFVDDRDAVPGASYWYRFDVEPANGGPQVFGPYRVTIPAPYAGPFHLRVFPNPARAASRVEIYLRGAVTAPALPVVAEILDLQGRRVRTLWNGPLATGVSTLAWDGRDPSGGLQTGTFFLRVRSPLGSAVQRVVRIR